jgi:hypothetical protein
VLPSAGRNPLGRGLLRAGRKNAISGDRVLGEGPADAPRGYETVLVVEDDSYVRGYAVGSLESLGYHVLTAANGPEALAKLSQRGGKIDVLFSDIVMPGGWQLAQQAQQQYPGLKILGVRPRNILRISRVQFKRI